MFYKANSNGYKTMLAGIRMKTLVHGERTLLSEFKLDKGAVIPKHQHPQEQTGYLVAGSLRFFIGDDARVAKPGDSWNLPSEIIHGAEALEDSVVIEVFSPVREDYLP